MKRITMHRPMLQMLLPSGLLLADAILSLWATQKLNSLVFLGLSIVLVGMAVVVGLAWKGFHYEIRAGQMHQGYLQSPVLTTRVGLFNYSEKHVPLRDLMDITVHRPVLWRWCDGATIIVHFVNGQVLDLGLVSNAAKAVELLYTAMPLRTYTWNTVEYEYEDVFAKAA